MSLLNEQDKSDKVDTSIKSNKTTIDPLLNYYFNGVQNTIKKIIALPPYSIDEDELDNFINLFFLNKYNDTEEIKAIVNDCFSKDVDYMECAYKLLERFYTKFYNNFYVTKGTNSTVAVERMNLLSYDGFINEGAVANDGENGFLILLQVLGDIGLKFIHPKNKRYLNTGNFNLFFYTTSIPSYSELTDELEQRKSLTATYNTFKSMINSQGLAFYFSVKDYIMDYGFYDINNHSVTVTGRFKMDSSFLKRLPRYESTNTISDILAKNNINNLVFLGKIRKEFKEFISESKPIVLLNDKILVKKFMVTDFKNTATTHEQYLAYFANWVLKRKWNNRIQYYVDLDGDNVGFYIKIK